jgi:hypothetical protein
LIAIFTALEKEGWRYSSDTGWKDWDIRMYGNQFWSVQVRTVTEYHGGPKCLTRARLEYRPVVTTVLLNLLIISTLGYRYAFLGKTDRYAWVVYGLLLLWLASRAWRLKRRAADLIIASANREGFIRVFGKASKPVPAAIEAKD